MEMKKINSGKLRAIGYDAKMRLLQVQLDNGAMLQSESARTPDTDSEVPGQPRASITTTSKENSPLRKSWLTHVWGRIFSFVCSFESSCGTSPFISPKTILTHKGKSMSFSQKLVSSVSFRYAVFSTLILTSSFPITASATLLGRLNVYSNNQIAQTRDERALLDLHARFTAQKLNYENEINDVKAKIANNEAELIKSGDNALSQEQKDRVNDELSTQKTVLNNLEERKRQLSDIISALFNVITELNLLHSKQAAVLSAMAALKADSSAADKQALVKAKESVTKAEESVAIAYNTLDKLFANITVLDETTNGIQEGVGSAFFINTNTSSSLALNAYRFNILLGAKGDACAKGPFACVTETSQYYSFPMYVFLKKTTVSQVDSKTLSNDLLDNEHGGTVNIKFSGAWKIDLYSLRGWKPFDFSKSADPSLRQYGTKLILDFGIKAIEAPASQVAGAAPSTNLTWVGAGYAGVGLNFEFPIFTPSGDSSELKQNIKLGSKPAGGMAIGFGLYKNFVGSSQIDSTVFSTPLPSRFSLRALMYEIQITDLLSIKGTRTVPSGSNNPLGTYTSFAVGYKF